MTIRENPISLRCLANGNITDHATRASIGSGALFAEHEIAMFSDLQDGMTLHQAKMLAFRLVQTIVTAAGGVLGVGGAVQMAVVTPGTSGKAISLPDNDGEINDAVEGWKKLEAERFHDHAPPA